MNTKRTTQKIEEMKKQKGSDLIDYPQTLPYEYDTRPHGRMVLRVATIVDILLAITAAELAFWAETPLWKFWFPCILVALIVIFYTLALYTFRAAGGAFGFIGKETVSIDPDKFLGINTRTHQGSFPTKEFAGLVLFRVGPHKHMGVLHIVNKNPLLRITIGFGLYDKIKRDADFLAKELSLPLHEPTLSQPETQPEEKA